MGKKNKKNNIRNTGNNKKKGLLYVLEGIVAALILVGYLFEIISSTPSPKIIEKQIAGRESVFSYLMAYNNLTAKDKILRYNLFPEFASLSTYILGVENRYDIAYLGESKNKLFIGWYVPPERAIKTNYYPTLLNKNTCEAKFIGEVQDIENMVKIKYCLEGYLKEENTKYLVVIPQDNKKTNLLFLDLNKDGKYKVGGVHDIEGPYVYDEIINTPLHHYYIASIPKTNNTYFLFNLNNKEVYMKEFFDKKRKINSQYISYFLYFFTKTQPLKGYDLLIFPKEIPTNMENNITKYYYSGKDIILLSAVPFHNFYSFLFDVYPLAQTPYEYKKSTNIITMNDENKTQKIEDYIYNIATNTYEYIYYTSPPLPNTYSANDIGDRRDISYNIMNLSIGNYTIATYEKNNVENLYIDYDNDKNFDEFPDNVSINTTEQKYSYFYLGEELFKLDKINNGIVYFHRVKNKNLEIMKISPQILLYPNESTNTWRMYYKNSEICINCNIKENKDLVLPLTKKGNNLWEGTLTLKQGVWSYKFYVVNESSTVYIYFPKLGAKKYYSTNQIDFYPEKYRYSTDLKNNKIIFKLVSRAAIPYMSDKQNSFGGDAVILDGTNPYYYKDEAAYLYNLIYTLSSNNIIWIRNAKKVGEATGDVMVSWKNVPKKEEYNQIINILINKHFE